MSELTKIEKSPLGIYYFKKSGGCTMVHMRSLINLVASPKMRNRVNMALTESWSKFESHGRLKEFEEQGYRFDCKDAPSSIRLSKWANIHSARNFILKNASWFDKEDEGITTWKIKAELSNIRDGVDRPLESPDNRASSVNWPSERYNSDIVSNTLRMRIDCLTYELSQANITISALRNQPAVIDQKTIDELEEAKSKLALAEHKVQELELQVRKLTDTALTSQYGSVFFNREAFLEACDEVGINREYAEKHMLEHASSALSESILATAQRVGTNSGYRKTGEECLNSWGLRRLKELDITKFAVKVYTDIQKNKLNNM